VVSAPLLVADRVNNRKNAWRSLMARTRGVSWIALAATLVMGAAAAAQPKPPLPTYPVAQAPASFGPAVQQADMVIMKLQAALLSELLRRLDVVGPAEALDSCHLAAIPVEQSAGRYEGVAVGRTSARLRNPANAPRAWASPIVERYATNPKAKVDGFVVDLGDRVGVLRPIREQPICQSCHGPERTLGPGVRVLLARRYPLDQAVGFREGDIRGWFWAEVRTPRR
jgi:hypothetical protein